ncbi:MAG TPA: SH3 domain-containing protein [Thermomicrobiales bacterium]|nr:SH3 domain-containing protein [Thermomicrobiales bacterium]
MSDPGLSHRLRQRSRRAGFMIGLSMILTIALCAVGFTVIYTALDGFTTDFVSSQEGDDDVTPTGVDEIAEELSETSAETPESQPTPDEQPADTEGEEPAPTPTPSPEGEEDDDDGFDPDYQVGSVTVNLREGPSTSTGIVNGLPPATPLQYLGEEAPTESPSDGDRWMRFVTEDGLEGWIREIDVTEFVP